MSLGVYKKIRTCIIAGILLAAGIINVYSADAEQSTSYSTVGLSSTDEITYNINDLEIFSGRSMQEIADKYSDARYANPAYNDEDYTTWYDELPSVVYPYNAGKISNAASSEMTAMTNFYRWLVGCDSVSELHYDEDTLPLQTGALVRNFSWQHIVSDSQKPADMSDELWQQGAGCDHNILAKGYTPIDAVLAWMSEGYDYERETWKSVGHRAILMNYKLTEIAYGYCDTVAIGKGNTSRKDMNQPFVAYPAPGYMPSNLVNSLNCAWSLQLNDDLFEFEDIEDVTVNITNLSTGEKWQRCSSNETMIYSFSNIAFAQPGDFNESDQYEDSYQVEVTGIHDIENDAPAKLVYTINFFDMNDYIRTHVSSVETYRKYMLGPDMMSDENLRRVAAILPKEVEITADNGRKFTVGIKGEWRLDTTNKRFVATGDLSDAPSRLSDPFGLLNEISIPYCEKTDICAIYDTLDIMPSTVKAGEKVSLYAYRTNMSSDTVHIFKLKNNSDGNFMADKVFDSSKVSDSENEVIEGYDIAHASGSDSGEYISVYFDNSWLNDGYITPIMVSNAVSTLNVECLQYDVNGDGLENMQDVILMNKIICCSSPCTVYADVNNDGKVNIFDLSMIKDYVRNML